MKTAHLPNRMAGFFQDEADEAKIAAINNVEEREAFWLETLHLAMVELRAELKSENLKVRSKAAHKIIDLERTKLRHAKKATASLTRSASDGCLLAGRASDGEFGTPPLANKSLEDECSEDPSLARPANKAEEEDPSLARPANKIAEIENTAIDMLSLDVQKLTGWLCGKLQLKNRCEASLEQSRDVVLNFMRVNKVTAMKIDYQELMLVVTNLMMRIKDREEAADGNREECQPSSDAVKRDET